MTDTISDKYFDLFDLGYNDLKHNTELLQVARHFGARVIDVRFVPNTRNPEFSGKTLKAVFADLYVHVPELGNANYKGSTIKIVDLDKGVATVADLLLANPVIVMCCCWKRNDCHRLVALREIQRLFDITSTHITGKMAREICAKSDPVAKLQPALF